MNKEVISFTELQKKMQLGKVKIKDAKYASRSAEDIYNLFKELDTDWELDIIDDIIVILERPFIKSTVSVKRGDEIHTSFGFAELSDVPILNTQKGSFKQMQEPQWTGAVSSYARKFGLQGLFAIGEKDVDEYNIQDQESLDNYIDYNKSIELYDSIKEACSNKGQSLESGMNWLLQTLNIPSLNKMPIDMLQNAEILITRLAQPRKENNKRKDTLQNALNETKMKHDITDDDLPFD